MLVDISPSPPPEQVLRRVKHGGLVLLNRESRLPTTGPFELAHVPASRIAQENGILSSEGRPMGNVAVLGACIKLLVPDGLEFLEAAVRARTGARPTRTSWLRARATRSCTKQHRLAGDAPLAPAGRTPPAQRPPGLRGQHDRLARRTTPARGRSTGR